MLVVNKSDAVIKVNGLGVTPNTATERYDLLHIDMSHLKIVGGEGKIIDNVLYLYTKDKGGSK